MFLFDPADKGAGENGLAEAHAVFGVDGRGGPLGGPAVEEGAGDVVESVAEAVAVFGGGVVDGAVALGEELGAELSAIGRRAAEGGEAALFGEFVDAAVEVGAAGEVGDEGEAP